MTSRRSVWQLLAIVVLSALVALMIAEALIRGLDLFAPQRRTAVTETAEREPPPAQTTTDLPGAILHPWLAYSQAAGTPALDDKALRDALGADFDSVAPEVRWQEFAINAQGFTSNIDDYRTVEKSTLVIAVFGGADADLFAMLAQGAFKADLAGALGVDAPSLEVLSFAKVGYRQPQQANALLEALILDVPIDLVLNLDGFDEAALGGADCERGQHPALPSAQHYLTLVNALTRDPFDETLRATLEVHRLKGWMRRVRTVLGFAGVSHLETAKALFGAALVRLQRRSAAVEEGLQEASVRSSGRSLPVPQWRLRERNACAATVAGVWLRSSLAMAATARQFGIGYVHVLQPNRFIERSKPPGDAEAAPDALSAHAASGYPALIDRSPELVAKGVRFADLTRALADDPSLYAGGCCRYTVRGHRALLQRVTPLLVDELRARPSD